MHRLIVLLVLLAACSSAPKKLPAEVTQALALEDTPPDYDEPLPAHFGTPAVRAADNTPADNPITDDGATLGRVLFYDTLLSLNETVACATCHVQANAFAEPLAVSEGFAGGHTTRNSMSLTNARFYARGSFFWDERAATLEQQVLLPIQNEVEMGLTLEELVARVSAAPYYPPLFDRAFGDERITVDRIAKALAQFVRSIVSYRSRYDEGVAATGNARVPFASFTAQENLGKQVFFAGAPGTPSCSGCHVPGGPMSGNAALFYMDRPRNNGLDLELGIDDGVGAITGVPLDRGLFKSPELRNAGLTAPYMHDGRFATLEEVVEHYRTGIEAHPNLDRTLTSNGVVRRFEMSDEEAAALVAFLHTLSDTALTTDPRFSDPFRAHQDASAATSP